MHAPSLAGIVDDKATGCSSATLGMTAPMERVSLPLMISTSQCSSHSGCLMQFPLGNTFHVRLAGLGETREPLYCTHVLKATR